MVKIIVELEIEGDQAHAFAVVDSVLDSGVFQDAINEFEDDIPNVRVVSAISRAAMHASGGYGATGTASLGEVKPDAE